MANTMIDDIGHEEKADKQEVQKLGDDLLTFKDETHNYEAHTNKTLKDYEKWIDGIVTNVSNNRNNIDALTKQEEQDFKDIRTRVISDEKIISDNKKQITDAWVQIGVNQRDISSNLIKEQNDVSDMKEADRKTNVRIDNVLGIIDGSNANMEMHMYAAPEPLKPRIYTVKIKPRYDANCVMGYAIRVQWIWLNAPADPNKHDFYPKGGGTLPSDHVVHSAKRWAEKPGRDTHWDMWRWFGRPVESDIEQGGFLLILPCNADASWEDHWNMMSIGYTLITPKLWSIATANEEFVESGFDPNPGRAWVYDNMQKNLWTDLEELELNTWSTRDPARMKSLNVMWERMQQVMDFLSEMPLKSPTHLMLLPFDRFAYRVPYVGKPPIDERPPYSSVWHKKYVSVPIVEGGNQGLYYTNDNCVSEYQKSQKPDIWGAFTDGLPIKIHLDRAWYLKELVADSHVNTMKEPGKRHCGIVPWGYEGQFSDYSFDYKPWNTEIGIGSKFMFSGPWRMWTF